MQSHQSFHPTVRTYCLAHPFCTRGFLVPVQDSSPDSASQLAFLALRTVVLQSLGQSTTLCTLETSVL